MQTTHQIRVEEFMAKAGQDVPYFPTEPSDEIKRLRARLILEEALETISGLGFVAIFATSVNEGRTLNMDTIRLEEARICNIEEVVDGCADLSVVTTGTLSAFGIEDHEILQLVDANNLAKFGPGGYRDAGGKWIKPPGHKKPDFASEIARQFAGNCSRWQRGQQKPIR